MPEINNKIQGESKSTGKPEAQFVLPQRRGYSKYIIIPVGLIVLLGAAWITYTAFSKPAAAPSTDAQPVQEEEPEVKAGTSFYLGSKIGENTQSSQTTRLYQHTPNSDIADKEIFKTEEKFFNVVAKTNQPYVYIASAEKKFYKLNANSAKLEELFGLAESPNSRGVAVSEDQKWLAYGRNFEGADSTKSGGSVWLYNFETKEHRELVKKTELGLYQGFSVLGWRKNDSELIVSALGGDAGASWGDIYQVSASTGALSKVSMVVEKGVFSPFILGELSPDGNKWLYQYCQKPVNNDKEGVGHQPCASGTELRVYDFATKESKTVYQNLRYDNNTSKDMLRVIIDFEWKDNNNIVAVVPGAILDILATNGKSEEVYTFDRSNPQLYTNHFINIQDVNKDQIVFTDSDEWNILDLNSGKLVNLNSGSTKLSITDWLD